MNSEKHNPDVVENYNTTLKTRPTTTFEATDKVWKGITETKDVIQDKPSPEEIEARLTEETAKRDKERKFIKRKNHMKLDKIEEVDDTKTQDFQGLKKAIILENDKLQKEKETYNKFLEDLSDLI